MPKARQRPAGGMTAVLLSAQSMFALAACLFPDTRAISAQAPGAAPSDALDIALCDDTTLEMTSLKGLAEEQERAVDTFTNQRSDGGRHLLQRRLCSRRRRCATGMNTGCTGSHKFALSEGTNDLDVITKDYFVLGVTRRKLQTPGTAEEHTKDRKHLQTTLILFCHYKSVKGRTQGFQHTQSKWWMSCTLTHSSLIDGR